MYASLLRDGKDTQERQKRKILSDDSKSDVGITPREGSSNALKPRVAENNLDGHASDYEAGQAQTEVEGEVSSDSN